MENTKLYKKLTADSLIPLHIVDRLLADAELAEKTMKLPDWLQRRLVSVEKAKIAFPWKRKNCGIFFTFNVCHSHTIEIGQNELRFNDETIPQIVGTYKRFETLLSGYAHPLTLYSEDGDDYAVSVKEWASLHELYETPADVTDAVRNLAEKVNGDAVRFELKGVKGHINLSLPRSAANDRSVIIHWNEAYPQERLNDLLQQYERLKSFKDWANSYYDGISVFVKPKP